MLVRNLDYLSIPKEFSKVELDIYDNKSIALVYIQQKGYSLVLKNNEEIDSVFLLKTDILPNNVDVSMEVYLLFLFLLGLLLYMRIYFLD